MRRSRRIQNEFLKGVRYHRVDPDRISTARQNLPQESGLPPERGGSEGIPQANQQLLKPPTEEKPPTPPRRESHSETRSPERNVARGDASVASFQRGIERLPMGELSRLLALSENPAFRPQSLDRQALVDRLSQSRTPETFNLFRVSLATSFPSAEIRSILSAVDRAFHGIFQMVNPQGRALNSILNLMGFQRIPTSPEIFQASVVMESLRGAPETQGKFSSSSFSVQKNVLISLQTLLHSPAAISQNLAQSLLESLIGLVGWNAFLEKPEGKNNPWSEKLRPGQGLPLLPGQALPAWLQALPKGAVVSNPPPSFLKELAQMFQPLLRALFGGFLMKGPEIELKSFRSILMDELGALMARRNRRRKDRNGKRVSRTDRVTRKDQSLPVDTHSEQEEGSGAPEIESWVDPTHSDKTIGFLWI